MIRTLAKEAALLTSRDQPSYVTHCAVEPGVTWTKLLAELRVFNQG